MEGIGLTGVCQSPGAVGVLEGLAEVAGQGPRGPAAGEGPATANPPLLTGGLLQLGACHKGESVDYLTFTVGPGATLRKLMATSRLEEVGGKNQGFAKSEKRLVMGGYCWRRYAPQSESRAWGKSYESWQYGGPVASIAASQLQEEEVRPSRVDVAFDYRVEEDYRPEDWMALVRGRLKERRLKDGSSGEGGVYTWYVGARSSKRRIRCYRKDLEDEGWAQLIGPTLRVELILMEELARSWWSVWRRSRDDGFAAAASHIEEMTGFQARPLGEVPELVLPQETGEVSKFIEFLKQHGPRLVAWADAGIPVIELASEMFATSGRMAVSRRRRRVEEIERLGVEEFVSLVRAMRPGLVSQESQIPI